MKATITIIAALSGAFLAAAANADTVQGCEVKDMGGYLNKVDATCVFNHQPGGSWSPNPAAFPPGGISDILDDLLNG